MFEHQFARINAKYDCISVKGVILWNECRDELKNSVTWYKFKQMYKRDVLKLYMGE